MGKESRKPHCVFTPSSSPSQSLRSSLHFQFLSFCLNPPCLTILIYSFPSLSVHISFFPSSLSPSVSLFQPFSIALPLCFSLHSLYTWRPIVVFRHNGCGRLILVYQWLIIYRVAMADGQHTIRYLGIHRCISLTSLLASIQLFDCNRRPNIITTTKRGKHIRCWKWDIWLFHEKYWLALKCWTNQVKKVLSCIHWHCFLWAKEDRNHPLCNLVRMAPF